MSEKSKDLIGAGIAGIGAGCINGILGGAGGLILIPALRLLTRVKEQDLFSVSVSVMLPVCLVSLFLTSRSMPLPWADAAPYLIGSALGGIMAGLFGRQIPNLWLHRILGAMILWGGIRYLC